MQLAEILGLVNLVGLAALAVLVICLWRRREPTSQAPTCSPEELRQSEARTVTAVRQELRASEAALRQELGESRKETVETVQAAVTRLGTSQRQAQADAAEAQNARLQALTETLDKQIKTLTETLDKQVKTLSDTVNAQMQALTEAQAKQMQALAEGQNSRMDGVAGQVRVMAEQSAAAQAQMRKTLEEQLTSLQTQNSEQLEKMRATVDEKLQKTLDERISQSFKLVNDRLTEVYQGLGEMKTLAGSVGDLKKVLTGVKTRGILGEIQLGSIIEEMLTPDQYEQNVSTKKGSRDVVEYAVCLPGDGDERIYLPIDAKFPGETYTHLADAYESGDAAAIKEAQKQLVATLKSEARDIQTKYIDPPATTNFGIMFLPVEGLYAEAVRLGVCEELRRQYQVTVAGPTTFAALLNSLQMGFRTLAIQKRSGEVWKVLGAVKTEFGNFQSVLEAAQKRIQQTSAELDKLVGVRTRQINSKLRTVSEATPEETAALLPANSGEE